MSDQYTVWDRDIAGPGTETIWDQNIDGPGTATRWDLLPASLAHLWRVLVRPSSWGALVRASSWHARPRG